MLSTVSDRLLVVDEFTYDEFGEWTIEAPDGNVEFYDADVTSTTDYYPYGMTLRSESDGNNYRYGFQGQEDDPEVKGVGNSTNYKYRMHDPRIGRFFATDPLEMKYPYLTPYQFSSNQPIHAPELEGLESAMEFNAMTGQNPLTGSHTTLAFPTLESERSLSANLSSLPRAFHNFGATIVTGAGNIPLYAAPEFGGPDDLYEEFQPYYWTVDENYEQHYNQDVGWGTQESMEITAKAGTEIIVEVVAGKVFEGVTTIGKNLLKKLDNVPTTGNGRPPSSSPKPAPNTTQCFVAGTLIAADSGFICIDKLKIGDKVWSFNETLYIKELKRINRLFVNKNVEVLYKIILGLDTILTTPEHPFYISGEWVKAKNLKIGNTPTFYDNSVDIPITKISLVDTLVTVYNFEVEENHSYYVSNLSLLVHNQCIKRGILDDDFVPGLELEGGYEIGSFGAEFRITDIGNPTSTPNLIGHFLKKAEGLAIANGSDDVMIVFSEVINPGLMTNITRSGAEWSKRFGYEHKFVPNESGAGTVVWTKKL